MWLAAALATMQAAAAPEERYPNEIVITLQGAGAPAGAPAVTTPARQAGYYQTATAEVQYAAAPRQQSQSAALRQARLGIVRKDNTRIYRRPDPRSQELFRCAAGTALGLVGQTKRYYAVLMIDHSYGFVEKSRVELYDYGVTIDPQAAQASQRIVQIALEYIGVPYVWGGNGRGGLDCSGFVKAVFARLGVNLPRVAREQFNVGRAVRWGELAPGDRLYFSTHGTYIDHTGIYIGGGRFIHASGSHGAVVVSSVTEPKYYRTLVGARRI